MADEKRLTDRYALRLPEGMLKELSDIASANKRSTNAEIIARLEWSMTANEHGNRGSAPAPIVEVAELDHRVKATISEGLRALSDDDIQYLAGRVASNLSRE